MKQFIYVLDFGDIRKFGRTSNINRRMSSYRLNEGEFRIVDTIQVENLDTAMEIERKLRKKFKLATVRGHEWITTPSNIITEYVYTITGENTFWRRFKLNTKIAFTPLTSDEKVNKKKAEASRERRSRLSSEGYYNKKAEEWSKLYGGSWDKEKIVFYTQGKLEGFKHIDRLWEIKTNYDSHGTWDKFLLKISGL